MNFKSLFKSGDFVYRIPSLIHLPSGRLIAFCEKRQSVADNGTIVIVSRISDDLGASFSDEKTVLDMGSRTLSNPCPVFDKNTGRIHLLVNGNPKDDDEYHIKLGRASRRNYHILSEDFGNSWSEPKDITDMSSREGFAWLAFGPCHAEQLKSGRLIFPMNHSYRPRGDEGESPYYSNTLYSDDGGESWQLGSDIGENTNECSLARLPDGRLYMNMRSYHGKGLRAVSYSCDGGESFSYPKLDTQLQDPVCQGSCLYFKGKKEALLFSNASDSHERMRLTLHASLDFGNSWPKALSVYPGACAYSDLAQLSDTKIACLFECGDNGDAYDEIRLALIDIDEILS